MFNTTTQHEDPAAAATGAPDPAAAAAQAQAGTDPAAAAGGAASLIPGAGAEAAAAEAAKPFGERVPEKYRVVGADGALDIEATASKVEQARAELERKLGSGDRAPEKPEDYKLEAPKDAEGKPVEGLDWDSFTKDPLFQSFQKAAHAKGMSNAQLQFVTEKYLELAPQLFQADKALTVDEARAEIAKVWPDQGAQAQNLQAVRRAIAAFGGKAEDMPGSAKRVFDKYGTDPDFIVFAAAVGAEMKEDRPAGDAGAASEVEAEALMKSPAYWDANHADHAATKAKVAAYYARKYGNTPHR